MEGLGWEAGLVVPHEIIVLEHLIPLETAARVLHRKIVKVRCLSKALI